MTNHLKENLSCVISHFTWVNFINNYFIKLAIIFAMEHKRQVKLNVSATLAKSVRNNPRQQLRLPWALWHH
jgi:hypothetical protein